VVEEPGGRRILTCGPHRNILFGIFSKPNFDSLLRKIAREMEKS
jgi:hypothetical protein